MRLSVELGSDHVVQDNRNKLLGAVAQTAPAPSAITRTVVAASKLPTVTDVPLHFRAVGVTLTPGEKSGALAANGILYQISGSTEILVGGETRMLSTGEGLFIAAGKTATLKAEKEGPSTFLHFFLVPAADLDRPGGDIILPGGNRIPFSA